MLHRSRAALVVAHPGHEMCVYGWLESARPRVFVLTDGSGRAGQSRLLATTKLLGELGLEPGSIFGRFTDRAIYSAVMAQDNGLFLGLARELASAFVREKIEAVVGDASEGYNSTHDLCRALINAAVSIAQRASGQQIANYDFPVVGQPSAYSIPPQTNALWLRLEESVFQRKLTAVQRYYPELLAEMEAALDRIGPGPWRTYLELTAQEEAEWMKHRLDAFRVECLRPVLSSEQSRELTDEFKEKPPFYELHGEAQVAAGHYDQVIRYREHIRPIAVMLRQVSRECSRGHAA